MHGNQQLENAQQYYDDTKPALLKMHGDERYPSQRVFLGKEYKKAYAIRSYLRRELSRVAGGKSLLFMGCSLAQDRTMQVLQKTARADSGQPEHFAFLPLPTDTDWLRERESFLTDHGIYPIWYDAPTPADHDDAIEALLVGLLRELKKL